MSKYFVIDESVKELPKEEVSAIENEYEVKRKNAYLKNREKTKSRLENKVTDLKCVHNRIIIVIDLDGKNTHKFSDGTEIYLGRRFNNLNRRHTEPVNAYVIDAENIPKGAEILIHPNAICDANKINNYENISLEQNNSVRYYSIETISAFLWRIKKGSTWNPVENFATALRVFKPYAGNIAGIRPFLIKNVLYITSGELEGKIVNTLIAADYEIIFQGDNGQEQRLIRCRHYENMKHDREEIIAINYELTEQFNYGKLLIGLDTSDCKTINDGN